MGVWAAGWVANRPNRRSRQSYGGRGGQLERTKTAQDGHKRRIKQVSTYILRSFDEPDFLLLGAYLLMGDSRCKIFHGAMLKRINHPNNLLLSLCTFCRAFLFCAIAWGWGVEELRWSDDGGACLHADLLAGRGGVGAGAGTYTTTTTS